MRVLLVNRFYWPDTAGPSTGAAKRPSLKGVLRVASASRPVVFQTGDDVPVFVMTNLRLIADDCEKTALPAEPGRRAAGNCAPACAALVVGGRPYGAAGRRLR